PRVRHRLSQRGRRRRVLRRSALPGDSQGALCAVGGGGHLPRKLRARALDASGPPGGARLWPPEGAMAEDAQNNKAMVGFAVGLVLGLLLGGGAGFLLGSSGGSEPAPAAVVEEPRAE